MPRAPTDEITECTELEREGLPGCEDALAVSFPEAVPWMALIELPDDRYKWVRRRDVLALRESRREEAEQLKLDLWPSPPAVELPDPGMARTVTPTAEEPGPVMVQAPLLSIRGVVPERVSARGV